MEQEIVYGVKYYIRDNRTEFDIFKSLEEAEDFWNDTQFDTIVPMKIVKGTISKNDIYINSSGKLCYNENHFCFRSSETIKTFA